MRKWIALFVSVTGLSILAGPLLAHHGRGATYDMNNVRHE